MLLASQQSREEADNENSLYLGWQLYDHWRGMGTMMDEGFMPFYASGEEIRVGDHIRYVGGPLRIVTNLFPPDHEISRLYEMERGCVEIAPATIENLPLDEDIDLVQRGDT